MNIIGVSHKIDFIRRNVDACKLVFDNPDLRSSIRTIEAQQLATKARRDIGYSDKTGHIDIMLSLSSINKKYGVTKSWKQ